MATGAPATDRSFIDKIGWPFLPAVAGTATLLVSEFGLDLSVDQMLAVNGFVAAAASFLARQKVTPWKPDVFKDWSAKDLVDKAEKVTGWELDGK